MSSSRAPSDRLGHLEAWWSRFVPSSDLCRINAGAGQAVEVQPETLGVVELAIAAWALTGGRFDPSVLPALVAAGYDRPFTAIAAAGPAPVDRPTNPTPAPGCADVAVDVDAGTIRLPVGVQLDLGGIGKGHAADIVARELLASGATGACVNLGGDVRVTGSPPDGAGWTIAVQHPLEDASIVTLALADGAVATSTTAYRRWGDDAHHLIDPATGLPSRTDLLAVTVVAGEAAWAEVIAKAALLAGLDGAPGDHRGPGPHRPARRRRRQRVDPAWPGGSRRMNPQLWWFVTRSTGIVTWVLATATVLWGLGVTSKPFGKKPAPNWTLDLHRFLGALTAAVPGRAPRRARGRQLHELDDRRPRRAVRHDVEARASGVGDRRRLAAAGGRGQLPVSNGTCPGCGGGGSTSRATSCSQHRPCTSWRRGRTATTSPSGSRQGLRSGSSPSSPPSGSAKAGGRRPRSVSPGGRRRRQDVVADLPPHPGPA